MIRSLLIWTVIPVLILVTSEFTVRAMDRGSSLRAAWYEGVDDRMRGGAVDFLFIGTSRTASGLVPSAFESELESLRSGEDVVSMNLGRAFSGAVAHYFGLRELLQRHPEAMRDCTVSIEMSAGVPAFTSTWNDTWYFPGNTQLVVDYMRRADLMRFLGTDADFEARAGVVGRYLGRRSALVSGRRRLQQAVEVRGIGLVRSVLGSLGAKSATEGDLPAHRQLRRDAGGVKLQRDLVAERIRPEALAAQVPLRPWEDTVLCEAARMLREHGVRVLFHDVPVPSYVWRANETETRLADRRAFEQWCEGLEIPRVRAPIQVADEDFPDLSHLRASRIEEYSRSLARSIAALPE